MKRTSVLTASLKIPKFLHQSEGSSLSVVLQNRTNCLAVYDEEFRFLSDYHKREKGEEEGYMERSKTRTDGGASSPSLSVAECQESSEARRETEEKSRIRQEEEEEEAPKERPKRERLVLEYLLQPGNCQYPDFWFFQLWVSQDLTDLDEGRSLSLCISAYVQGLGGCRRMSFGLVSCV